MVESGGHFNKVTLLKEKKKTLVEQNFMKDLG